MGGCLKNLFAMVGCLTLLVIGAAVAWLYDDELKQAYGAFTGRITASGMVAQPGPGRPTADALRTALEKQEAMAAPMGPAFIAMTADEMAAIVVNGLYAEAARALDSVTVTLEPDRLTLEAHLVTAVWGREALGLFAGFLQAREPLRVAGTARIERPGIIAWTPDEVAIRNFPIPSPGIAPLVNSLTGRTTGDLWMAAPASIGRLQIRAEGVYFFRRER